jgi:hypothetical protein
MFEALHPIYAPTLIDELRVLRVAGLVTAFVPALAQMQCGAESHKPAQAFPLSTRSVET